VCGEPHTSFSSHYGTKREVKQALEILAVQTSVRVSVHIGQARRMQ
jgi:hypothetical protein